jgi:Hemerythrin HHE cation binding domain
MCEYCGCQALSPIGELTAEHDRVLGLISDVREARNAKDVTRMAELARRIAAVLAPHTEVEETALFPPLAADFPEQMAGLVAEHRQVEAVLGEASRGTPGDPAWPARLARALLTLRAHIFAEQDGVFPAALASLHSADWDAVEAARARAGTAVTGPDT